MGESFDQRVEHLIPGLNVRVHAHELRAVVRGRGLHLWTFQLNLSRI